MNRHCEPLCGEAISLIVLEIATPPKIGGSQ